MGRHRKATVTVAPERIRAMRARLGMSQREFAAALGVRKVTVQAWEQGFYPPGEDSLARLIALGSRYPAT
jgi:DNA-binding transcriptional regulator YiaG